MLPVRQNRSNTAAISVDDTRSSPNIVWLSGNDFQTWKNKADDDVVTAVARGIRSEDKRHLQTVELNYFVSSSLDDARWRPIVNLNSVYTYSPTYAELLKQYFRPDHIPNILIEANYEMENHYTGPQTLRRQEYWAMLSGAAGQFWGNKYTWQFTSGWQGHLATAGSRQLGYATSVFSRLPWYELVPDRDHTVVTSGYGAFSDEGDVNVNDFAAAARTPDGRFVVVYMPTGRTITVDTTRWRHRRAQDGSTRRLAATRPPWLLPRRTRALSRLLRPGRTPRARATGCSC